MRSPGFFVTMLLAVSLPAMGAVAQQPAAQASPQASPSPARTDAKAPATESPMARLTSARTVLVNRSRGSNIPFDTIKSTLEGWPRFTIVDSPEKADILVSVETFGDNDVQVSSGTAPNVKTGQMEQSSKSSKDLSATEIKMTVFDAKNKHVLWTSTEKVKFAMKKTTKESNMVEAAERLASRFHDRLEPPLPAR